MKVSFEKKLLCRRLSTRFCYFIIFNKIKTSQQQIEYLLSFISHHILNCI
jgi:hypothetical protein